jgi:hypothetical protein
MLFLVCVSYTNGRIPERIGTTEQCVKNRMHLILQKAGRPSRFELIVFCFGSGTVVCHASIGAQKEMSPRPTFNFAPGCPMSD